MGVIPGGALQSGLEARGFQMTRLNTYDTVAVSTVDPERLQLAKQARVVAIASPSAVKCGFQGVRVPTCLVCLSKVLNTGRLSTTCIASSYRNEIEDEPTVGCWPLRLYRRA